MPCDSIKLKMPSGVEFSGIICSRGRRPRKCSYCSRPHTKLCDFVVGHGPGESPSMSGMAATKTCDKPICGQCARHTEPDTDVCRIHPVAPENNECEACGTTGNDHDEESHRDYNATWAAPVPPP